VASAAGRSVPSRALEERRDAAKQVSRQAALARSGRFPRGIGEDPRARSISSSRSKRSALRVALAGGRWTFRPVDEAFGIPAASPGDFLRFSTPKDEGFRSPARPGEDCLVITQ
jgi:hypothetical protein